MFKYIYDKDGQPHKWIDSTNSREQAIIPFEEMIIQLREEICEYHPKYRPRYEIEDDEHYFATLEAKYAQTFKEYKNFPFEQALDIITIGLPKLCSYMDYYFLYASSSVIFSLIKILLNNKQYITKVLDSVILFTRDELFEIYLVDRKGYQQIIRGFYAIYGYDFRIYQLPFVKSLPLKYLPGLLFHNELNNHSIEPYDPCITSFSDKSNISYTRCMSPDIFIIPAYYIYLGIENNYFDPNTANWYKKCLDIGEPALFYNDVLDYNYRKSMKLNKGANFTYDRELVSIFSNQFKPRDKYDPESEIPLWYGFSYFLADTELALSDAKQIAFAAMQKPFTYFYYPKDLKPLPIEYRIAYEEAVKEEKSSVKKLHWAIAVAILIVLSILVLCYTKIALFIIGALTVVVLMPICIWALFQPTSHRRSSNNGPGGHYPAESSDFNSSDSLSWYGYSLDNVDDYNHCRWSDYYKINEYYNETK